MHKFGEMLNSRPDGREALLAIRPRIRNEKNLEIDFAGVKILTPSFADEFVTPLIEEFPEENIKLVNTQENITVKKTLEFLSENWSKNVSME